MAVSLISFQHTLRVKLFSLLLRFVYCTMFFNQLHTLQYISILKWLCIDTGCAALQKSFNKRQGFDCRIDWFVEGSVGLWFKVFRALLANRVSQSGYQFGPVVRDSESFLPIRIKILDLELDPDPHFWSWIRIRISNLEKCRIRIRIKSMRITTLNVIDGRTDSRYLSCCRSRCSDNIINLCTGSRYWSCCRNSELCWPARSRSSDNIIDLCTGSHYWSCCRGSEPCWPIGSRCSDNIIDLCTGSRYWSCCRGSELCWPIKSRGLRCRRSWTLCSSLPSSGYRDTRKRERFPTSIKWRWLLSTVDW